ncbi:MAG: hypothetical protein RLZZ71_2339 [Bacteroidota bacterium]|jgi:hypothetical protein
MRALVLISFLLFGLKGIAQPTDDYVNTLPSQGQGKEKMSDLTNRERTVVGGSLGLGLSSSNGSGMFFGSITPLAGYRITERFSAGVGFNFTYYKTRLYQEQYYAGIAWARLGLFNGIFACAEINQVNAPVYSFNGSSRETFPLLLAGAGISQGIGHGLGTYFQIMYDFTEEERSPYGPLIIRGGILIPLSPKK